MRIRPGDYIALNTDFSFGLEGWVIAFREIRTRDPETFVSILGEATVLTLQGGIITRTLFCDDMIRVGFGGLKRKRETSSS
jgi:hypothetical protein